MTSYDAEFTEFFTARAAWLRRLGFVLCGDWHTADDLVRSTFIKLFRNWRRVRSGSVDAYARKVLLNTYLSHRRDRRRETVVADVPERPNSPAPDVGTRPEIAQLLMALPPRQRAVVVLRYLEDLPVTEVADLLGMAEGTVKSQAARGVDALRRALTTSASTTKE